MNEKKVIMMKNILEISHVKPTEKFINDEKI